MINFLGSSGWKRTCRTRLPSGCSLLSRLSWEVSVHKSFVYRLQSLPGSHCNLMGQHRPAGALSKVKSCTENEALFLCTHLDG